MSRDKYLDFDLEVYPIGFIPELGVIIGLTQEVLHFPSRLSGFELKIKVKKMFSILVFNFFLLQLN